MPRKRLLISCLCLSLSFSLTIAAQPSEPATRLFPLQEIKLLAGPFQRAQERNVAYLLAHDVDRFLAPFRREAGLEPKAAPYPNWESQGLDGHSAGHYLTALAQTVATTGNTAVRERLAYMLDELESCAKAANNGYIGGIPGGREMWEEVAQGKIDAASFSLNGKWVPWYNLHKTFAGLRDVWLLTGDDKARRLLLGLTDWCQLLVADLSDEALQDMLRSEHGGMNEVLADVYAMTGNSAHLELARRFSHRATLDPLLQSEDTLTGQHANTQIPKVIGFARIGELGDEAAWTQAGRFFWDTVIVARSVAIGGNSVREHFHPRDDFSSMIESREGPETCNTYNMLRLTEQLFRLQPEARYADYYERALYNHILSTQHPKHGGYVYFTPMRPRHYRVYSQPEETFWCCVGSGMENHGRYGQFIYAHDDNALFVNLFIASELRWAERDLVLRQETRFPFDPRSTLTLELDASQRFEIKIRRPGWATADPLAIRINGERHTANAPASGYLSIEREWKDGDRIEIGFPMHMQLERLPDGSDYAAFRYGPIVLAAPTPGGETPGLIAGPGRMEHIAHGAYLPLDEAPMLVGSDQAVACSVRAVEGKELTFTAPAVIQPDTFDDLQLVPFFTLHDERYMIYWRIVEPEHYEAIVAELAGAEQARIALEARTVDHVAPGEQQPEVEHNLEGEAMATGEERGRRWRDAGEWFAYQLARPEELPLELIVTYDGGERDRHFDIVVNGQRIAEDRLKGEQPDRFVDVVYPIPESAVNAAETDVLNVRFTARENSRTARIFSVRLTRPQRKD